MKRGVDGWCGNTPGNEKEASEKLGKESEQREVESANTSPADAGSGTNKRRKSRYKPTSRLVTPTSFKFHSFSKEKIWSQRKIFVFFWVTVLSHLEKRKV